MQKSQEAFLLAIEIYNKPTIKYRLEGCLYFICNAWELMLKAKLLKEGKEIYYKGKNQTLSLTTCLERVLTNANDPIRINMDTIIKLRNMGTHLLIPEYQMLISPFLTAASQNYTDKMKDYFNVDVSELVGNDYMTLFISNQVQKVDILGKYGTDVFEKFQLVTSEIGAMLDEYADNQKVALAVNINLVRVKSRDLADIKYYISNDAKEENIKVIKEYKDVGENFTYSSKNLIMRINNALEKASINLEPVSENAKTHFSNSSLQIYNKEFNVYNNKEFTWTYDTGNGVKHKKFSEKLLLKIITDLTENPKLIYELNKKQKKN